MTSQIEEVDMDALKAEAKELNVPGWQVTKDPEKLKKKIDEAKGSKRSKAPKLHVSMSGESSRNKLIERLDKEDPECKYMTQSASLTQAEAEAKGIEIVRKNNGELMYCGEDIVCRTDKESYYEWQNNRTKESLEAMKSIDKDLDTERGGKKIQALTERVRAGSGPE